MTPQSIIQKRKERVPTTNILVINNQPHHWYQKKEDINSALEKSFPDLTMAKTSSASGFFF